MDQGGRLERLARLLLGHACGGELAQLVVDERQEFGRGLRVAGRSGGQELGDVGHAAEHTVGGTRLTMGEPTAFGVAVSSPREIH